MFVDLFLFTTLIETEGDEAAALLLDRFDRVSCSKVTPPPALSDPAR